MTTHGCDLRAFEYDGSRYCGAHFGFAHRSGDPWCDRAPKGTEAPINGVHVPHCVDLCTDKGHWLGQHDLPHRHSETLASQCSECRDGRLPRQDRPA